jgi:hypothetical protein
MVRVVYNIIYAITRRAMCAPQTWQLSIDERNSIEFAAIYVEANKLTAELQVGFISQNKRGS